MSNRAADRRSPSGVRWSALRRSTAWAFCAALSSTTAASSARARIAARSGSVLAVLSLLLIAGLIASGSAEAQTAPSVGTLLADAPNGTTVSDIFDQINSQGCTSLTAPEADAAMVTGAVMLLGAGFTSAQAESALTSGNWATCAAVGPDWAEVYQQAWSEMESQAATSTVAADTTGELVSAGAEDGLISGGEAGLLGTVAEGAVPVAAAAAVGVAIGTGVDYLLGLPSFVSGGTDQVAAPTVGWGAQKVDQGYDTEQAWQTRTQQTCTSYWTPDTAHMKFPQADQNAGIAGGSWGNGGPGQEPMPDVELPCSTKSVVEAIAQTDSGFRFGAGQWFSDIEADTSGNCVPQGGATPSVLGPAPGDFGKVIGPLSGPTPLALPEHDFAAVEGAPITSCSSGSGVVEDYAILEAGTGVRLSAPMKSCPSGATCKPLPNSGDTSGLTPASLGAQLGSPQYSDLNKYLTSLYGGKTASGDPAPPPGVTVVPSCAGDTYAACQSILSAAGFTGTTTQMTVAPTAQVDSDGAGNAIGTLPAAGSQVDPSTPIEVELNPSPLWVRMPAPNSGETATAYQTRLKALGLLGAISLLVVSATNESPTAGPNGVAGTYDQTAGKTVSPGDLVNPNDSVQINENPPDAPAAQTVAPPSGQCGLTPPSASVDLSPITSLKLGSVFPFSIIPWLSGLVGTAPNGQRPDLSFTVFGATIDATQPLGSTFDPVFSLFRSVVSVLLWIGAMLLLYRRITGSF